jgi:hypothetical protein
MSNETLTNDQVATRIGNALKLGESVKVFVKYFGSREEEGAYRVQEPLEKQDLERLSFVSVVNQAGVIYYTRLASNENFAQELEPQR